MDALILSCSTGGGHNAAAAAIREELERRGHRAVMLDPYKLAGRDLDRKVGNGYIRIAQRTPRLFGMAYRLADEYRRLPLHSPVYAVNKLMVGKMSAYLASHRYDVILMTHLYPGEILTRMKHSGMSLPPCIFIATDYVCIPFTEEIDCDAYVTPGEALNPDFIRRGIPAERLIPAGIPVRRIFSRDISREDAADALGLDRAKRYILLSGGSIGAGLIRRAITVLTPYLQAHPTYHLLVVCGNNDKLLSRLYPEYGSHPQMTLMASTDQMALYMKVSDAYLSKPGGLSSTEAAVSGTPLIHLAPIPGCETLNMAYFQACGMSLAVGENLEKLPEALASLRDPARVMAMQENQRRHVNGHAAADICAIAQQLGCR